MRPKSLAISCVLALLAGCEGEDLRPVWISDVTPRVAAPGDVLHVRGSGLAGGGVMAGKPADAGGVLLEGTIAVLVGGQPSVVLYRADDRIDLRVPEVPGGAAYVVVWTGGTASNAFPIHVLSSP